jgi:replication factor A1
MGSETVLEVDPRELRALLNGERQTIRVPVSPDAPKSTPIVDTALNNRYTLTGIVRSVSDVRTFQRDDGSEGRVRNVRIQDRTGSIRVALWGDHTALEMDVGDYLHLFDAEVDTGYQDDKEASVGYDASAKVIPHTEIDDERYITIGLTE